MSSGQCLRILLVEDDAEDALLFLRRCPNSYQVQHVDSAREALRVLRSGRFDVCFTDYRLGAETGLELVREIRSQGLRLPLIVITGEDVESLGENALLAGATDFVPKDGLDQPTIVRVARWALIRRHVELRREAAQGESAPAPPAGAWTPPRVVLPAAGPRPAGRAEVVAFARPDTAS